MIVDAYFSVEDYYVSVEIITVMFVISIYISSSSTTTNNNNNNNMLFNGKADEVVRPDRAGADEEAGGAEGHALHRGDLYGDLTICLPTVISEKPLSLQTKTLPEG